MIYELGNICLSIAQKRMVWLGIMGVLIQNIWKMLAAGYTLGLLVLSLQRCNLPSVPLYMYQVEQPLPVEEMGTN